MDESDTPLITSQNQKAVTRQPQACPRSRLSPERSRKYVRSGLTPRANDMSMNPLHKSSSYQSLAAGRRGGIRGGVRGGRNQNGRSGMSQSSANSSSDAQQSKPASCQPLPLSASSRRWRSADKLDYLTSERHARSPAGTLSKDTNKVDLPQVTEYVYNQDLEDEISDTSTRPGPLRGRINSDPLQPTHGSWSAIYGSAVVMDNAVSKSRNSNATKDLHNQPVAHGVDSVEIAQQIVQSEEDCCAHRSPSTEVFHSSSAPLPMSLHGHPFVLPMEDVPPPLTVTSVGRVPRSSVSSISSTKPHDDGQQPESDLAENKTAETRDTVTKTSQPPALAKRAWQDVDSAPTEKSETPPNSPTSPTSPTPASPRRKHSDNIDFRAAMSMVSKKPRPLPKSKSSWRLQAAKARESVASLLSFTKSKDKGLSLANKKSSAQYQSSPCLSDTPANASTPSFNATPCLSIQGDRNRAGQLSRFKGMHWSSPEMELNVDRSHVTEQCHVGNFQGSNMDKENFITNKPAVAPVDSSTIPFLEVTQQSQPDRGLDSVPSRIESTSHSEACEGLLSYAQCASENADEGQLQSAPLRLHSDTKTNKNLSVLVKQSPHYKSTPDLNSYIDISSPHITFQHGQELSRSQDCLATSQWNDKNSGISSQTDGSMTPNTREAAPASGDSMCAMYRDDAERSSENNEELEYKACPWLSPNLQRTLSAVRKHLSARGIYGNNRSGSAGRSASPRDGCQPSENDPEANFVQKEGSKYDPTGDSDNMSVHSSNKLLSSHSEDHANTGRTDIDYDEATKGQNYETMSKSVNVSNHGNVQLQLHKQNSDSIVDYRNNSVALSGDLSTFSRSFHSQSPESFGIPTRPKLHHHRPGKSRLTSDNTKRQRPTLTRSFELSIQDNEDGDEVLGNLSEGELKNSETSSNSSNSKIESSTTGEDNANEVPGSRSTQANENVLVLPDVSVRGRSSDNQLQLACDQRQEQQAPEIIPSDDKTDWDAFSDRVEYRHSPCLERSDSLTSLNSEVSALSTRSEARGKRETSRRVEDLLSNQLFKKHLARHADTIERKVFQMHKKGMRKSLSNFDLSTSQSAYVNDVVSNLLNIGDINNNKENSDDSDTKQAEDHNEKFKPKISRSVSMLDKHPSGAFVENLSDEASDDNNKPRHEYRRPLKKAATTISLRPPTNLNFSETNESSRRNSLSCDDPSLQKLKHNALARNEENCSPTALSQRRKRMYIPSFEEFKKHRSDSPSTRSRCQSEVSDIYVIQEDESDDFTHNTSSDTPSPSMDSVKSDRDSISRRDDGQAAKESQKGTAKNKGSGTSPVFMHPAIIITTADVSSIQDKENRRPPLCRSKSESHMKRRRLRLSPYRPSTPENMTSSQMAHTASTECFVAYGSKDDQMLVRISEESKALAWPLSAGDRCASATVLFQESQGTSPDHDVEDKDCLNNKVKPKAPISERTLAALQQSTITSNEDNLSDDDSTDVGGSGENDNDEVISDNTDNTDDNADSGSETESLSASKVFTNSAGDSDIYTANYKSHFMDGVELIPSSNNTSDDEGKTKQETMLQTFEFQPRTQNTFLGSFGFQYSVDSNFSRHVDHASGSFDDSFDSRRIREDDCQKRSSISDQGERSSTPISANIDDLGNVNADLKHDTNWDKAGRNESAFSVEGLQLSGAAAGVSYDMMSQSEDVSCLDVTLQRKSPTNSSSDSDQSNKTAVLRSTSDVSAIASDERERRRRERKDRPYKSDPFTGTNKLPQHSHQSEPGLHKAPSVSTSCSFPSLEELAEYSDSASYCEEEDEESRKRRNRLSNISTASEDSGVVGHTGHEGDITGGRSKLGCAHCAAYSADGSHTSAGGGVPHSLSDGVLDSVSMCKKCAMRARERKETIQEIAETEKKYGKDLNVLKEEFYRPMKATSLLTLDQLDTIFINLEELVHVHKQFMGKLTAALLTAVKAGDEELATVNIGSTFIESSTMFLAFENYCIHQAQSSTLLDQLEKEKELLRVFLEVAQNQNSKMRRMHLKSFLMMPVQRAMKYPLLLSRLYKVTPNYHEDKDSIKQAQENIEDILQHINAKTQIPTPMKRRSAELHGYSLSDKIEVNRVAIEVLGWNKKDVCDIITSRLWYGQGPDPTWASKRARNVKFNMVHAALLTLGRPVDAPSHLPMSPRDPSPPLQVAMVLVREKGGRYQLIRDPLMMDRCVVTVDPEYDHVFEIHEQGKETYLFKAENSRDTGIWIRHLKQLSRNLGYWRRRRNGVPNLFIRPA